MDDIDQKLEVIEERVRQSTAFQCPRCHGKIPNNETPGAYPGALSRLTRGQRDDPIYICSACGTHEAMQQFTQAGECTPISDWPLTGEDLADLRKWEEHNRQSRENLQTFQRMQNGDA